MDREGDVCGCVREAGGWGFLEKMKEEGRNRKAWDRWVHERMLRMSALSMIEGRYKDELRGCQWIC